MHHRKILFSLREEKIRRAQIRKSEENFFAGLRVPASGSGLASFVGGFPKMRSDFVQGMESFGKLRTFTELVSIAAGMNREPSRTILPLKQ